ncbi:homolog to endonuclease VapC (plasmid) [Halobacterium hubeiense]|jgi:putative PIN family toxin of toxin-antitoxin system|uniref:Homolog to endonuclease VapC n=1 Tax=Halobacterium hubeiense TaxID=1407499 RepID=A0A0U5HCB1_9EURY|nr:putative toxin-antitoxin system toxin component, PIN family [Halobacterium hubeiense]CQH65480.1 homolog to endonuclease VapC [Halobacterium hubeiense]
MKAVLDTNVLISSVIATGVPHDVVVKGFSSKYQIIVSVETLTEFRETLLKYPDRFGMDEDEVQQEVETIRYFAEFVEPDEEITAVEDDPDDDKFLEAAVAGNVDYVVSGDQHLLDLDSFRNIEIIDPRTFYEQLEAE